jgi:hypothetical protein
MTENAHKHWGRRVSTSYRLYSKRKHLPTVSAQCLSGFWRI